MRPPFISGKDRPDPGERLLAQGPKCTDARREQRRMMLRPEKHEFTFFFSNSGTKTCSLFCARGYIYYLLCCSHSCFQARKNSQKDGRSCHIIVKWSHAVMLIVNRTRRWTLFTIPWLPALRKESPDGANSLFVIHPHLPYYACPLPRTKTMS